MLCRAGFALTRTDHGTPCYQLVEERRAVLGEKRKKAKGALLKFAIRRERIDQDTLVAVEHAGTKVLGARDLSLELGELVKHFGFCAVQGFDER